MTNPVKNLSREEFLQLTPQQQKTLKQFRQYRRITGYELPYNVPSNPDDKVYEASRLEYQKLWYTLFFVGYSGQTTGGHKAREKPNVSKAKGSRVDFTLEYQGKKLTSRHEAYKMQALRDHDLNLGFDKMLSASLPSQLTKNEGSEPSICIYTFNPKAKPPSVRRAFLG